MHGRNHRNFGLSIVFLEQQPICLLRNSRDKHDVSYNIERRSLFSTCITRRTSERGASLPQDHVETRKHIEESRDFWKNLQEGKKRLLCRLWQRCSLDPRRSSFLPLHRREATRVHTCMRARHVRISLQSLQTSKQNRVYLPLCPAIRTSPRCVPLRNKRSFLSNAPRLVFSSGTRAKRHFCPRRNRYRPRPSNLSRTRAVNGFKIVPCRLYKRTQLRFLGNHFQIQTSSNRCRFVNRDRSNESNLSS